MLERSLKRLLGCNGLPGSANVVVSELIGVTWPVRRRAERAIACRAGRIRTSSKLMMDGVHVVLTHTPRVRLTHVGCWWNDQSCRLPEPLSVVAPMPGPIHRKVVRPNLVLGV